MDSNELLLSQRVNYDAIAHLYDEPLRDHGVDPKALTHVLWIGGATDAGKTTVARIMAERYGLQPYKRLRVHT